MPADPRRKVVNTRLFPEQVRKLNQLVAERTVARGEAVSRSRVIAELIEEEHQRGAGARRRRTEAQAP